MVVPVFILWARSPQGYTRSGEFEIIDAGNVSLRKFRRLVAITGKRKRGTIPPPFSGDPPGTPLRPQAGSSHIGRSILGRGS